MACESKGKNDRRVNQFNKIKLLNEVANQIAGYGVSQGNTGLMDYVDLNCGAVPEGEFEQVIDLNAPHQFLEMYMQIAENRFAFAVTELLKMNAAYMGALKEFCTRTGKELNAPKPQNVQNAMEIMESYVLDGMPCDETKQLVENTPEKITWKILMNTHEKSWAKAGGNLNVYYELLQCFINGIFDGSSVKITVNMEGGSIENQ